MDGRTGRYVPDRIWKRYGRHGGAAAWIAAMAVALMCAAPLHAAGVFRVDAASTATAPNGQTWGTAYKTIQTAVNAAYAADGGEVWVKAGAYTSTASPIVTMREGVNLYGGFAGTETDRTQRDWEGNVTSLDGQTQRQCVTGANNAGIDGFTIAYGYDDDGGGMANDSVSPIVTNGTFSGNTTGHGGDCVAFHPDTKIVNCIFRGNHAIRG